MKRFKILWLVLMLAAMFTVAAFLPEPWDTILFVVVIPLLQQLIKLIVDKAGEPLGKLANQIISLVLTLIFVALSGGFLGLEFPSLPAWNGDLILFLGAIATFIGDLALLIGASWGSMMALYEAIYDRLFQNFGLATADKM
jgi:hypothetical protein